MSSADRTIYDLVEQGDGGQRFDTDYQDDPVCPHCGKIQSDAWELSDGGEYDCDHCEEDYVLSRHVEVTYSTSKTKERR